MVVGAGAPVVVAQESTSGLEAMGVDPMAETGMEPAEGAAPALAAPVNEGQAIMERARDRMKRAQYVRYDAHMFATGAMTGYTTEAKGHVEMRKAPGNSTNPWMFRITGATVVKDGTAPTQFDMAMRANSREWVNHDERTVHETLKMAPGGKWFTVPNSLWPTDAFERVPYLTATRNATYEQEPGQEVNGVLCDVVVVEAKSARGGGGRRGRWFIGQEDSFPRRFERLVMMEGSETKLVQEFTNVRIEDSVPPEVTEAMLRVEVPAGYEEKRQTPPPPPPPPPVVPTATPNATTSDTQVKGSDQATEVAMGGSQSAARAEPARPAAPTMAPDFELPKLDGTKVSLASMRGSVVVVDFFGTWAMASESWHPQLKSIMAANEGVKLVPVTVRQREPHLAQELLQRAEIAEALLVGSESVAQAYGVQVYPAAAVIAADGRLIEVVQGCGSASSEETLRAAIQRAKGTSSSDTPSSDRAPAAADSNQSVASESDPTPKPTEEPAK